MNAPEVLSLPRLPRDDSGPIFAEPWQAQSFAMTLKLYEGGAFTWPEWAAALSAELAQDPHDDGTRYYDHWVVALEKLVAARSLAAPSELSTRKSEWAEAYRRTPHGSPVEL